MSMGYVRKITLLMVAFSVMLSTPFAFANSGGGEKFIDGVNYLPIKPALVVNYGGSGKVKYIKADISLRVEDMHSAEEVSHHMPLIRDTLIMLLSSMTDEQVGSGEGKELLREEALTRINESIEAQLNPGHEEKGKKKSEHSKSEHEEDAHAADDHAKSERSNKKQHASASVAHGPVSDVLFDNLVVQK